MAEKKNKINSEYVKRKLYLFLKCLFFVKIFFWNLVGSRCCSINAWWKYITQHHSTIFACWFNFRSVLPEWNCYRPYLLHSLLLVFIVLLWWENLFWQRKSLYRQQDRHHYWCSIYSVRFVVRTISKRFTYTYVTLWKYTMFAHQMRIYLVWIKLSMEKRRLNNNHCWI